MLPKNRDAAVSGVSHDVADTHTIVSDVQDDVVNIPAVVSDSHRAAVKNPKDTHGQNQFVSTIRTLPVLEQSFIPA